MTPVALTPQVQNEIARLTQDKKVDPRLLEEFACFVIQSSTRKSSRVVKPLKISELKQAIYSRFDVKNTNELKNSGAFKMATDGMGKFDFRLKQTWELLYRKFVGILPHEKDKEGYGCINGVDIFQYFKPWQVFGLDPRTATKADVKASYYQLSRIYHPDNLETGDRRIFEQLDTMYKSIIAGF